MKIEEALIRLRDDLKEWVTNNLNAIGKPKASDISIATPEGMASTDVQGAIGELRDSLGNMSDSLNNKFAVITGSFGSELNVGTLKNYPNGFTRENTVVIAEHFGYSTSLRDQYYASNLAMTVILHENAIEVSPRNATVFGLNFKVVLMRLF